MSYFIVFSMFYLYLYLCGRGLFIFISRKSSKKDYNETFFDLKISNFYVFIFLIFIGNITFLINFFIKTSIVFFLLFSVPLILINITHFELKLSNISRTRNIIKIFTLFILSLSTYSINLGYDAQLYHLASQLWIKSSKINFGLAGFHHRLGFSSIYDYISSNFWIFDNFIFLHFLNLAFIAQLLFILINYFYDSHKFNVKVLTISVLLFGLFDNFGFNGGKNSFIEVEGITKFDTPFGIIFSLTMLFMYIVNSKNFVNSYELGFLVFFILFSIQMRLAGALLLIPFMGIVVKFKNQLFKFLNENHIPKLAVFLMFLWILKNYILSGCAIFPVEFLCIQDLKWYEPGLASKTSNDISFSLKAYSFDQSINDWYQIWTNKFVWNKTTLYNLTLSMLFILTFIKTIYKNSKIFTKNVLPLFIINFLFLIFWLFTAPDFRFAIGFTLSCIFLIGLTNGQPRISINSGIFKIFFIALYVFTVALIPRIENYSLFIKDITQLKIISINNSFLETDAYVDKPFGYGVVRSNGDERCGLNLNCSPDYESPVTKEIRYNYNFFIPARK